MKSIAWRFEIWGLRFEVWRSRLSESNHACMNCLPLGPGPFRGQVLHVSSNKFSKTFRTRRSLEYVGFSESILSLGLAKTIWATKYEMLFERSEFIEWFEEFVFRPLSSGRFRTFLCFVSFGDERNENLLYRYSRKAYTTTKKHKNIGNNTAMCGKSAIFAFKFRK